jgi:folate-binding protein YgfZ
MTMISTVPDEPPAVGDVAGQPVVLTYGDPTAEYAALRTGAMLVDRSARVRLRLDGPKAAEMLTGLVTNDVVSLAPGHGQYAAALTPKGKIVADVRIFRDPFGVMFDAAPRARDGWMTMVRKYVNPRLAPFRDLSDSLRDIGVFGPQARRLAATVSGVPSERLTQLAPYAHIAGDVAGEPALVARVPDLEIEGFELFVTAAAFGSAWRALVREGGTPGGLAAWEIARVEAGRPEWGLDIDETTIPQEANLDDLHAISYTKGCYVGQETVARVHFRGHVNRHLRGLLCGHADVPPLKALLFDDAGKQVGDVRSAVLSPRLGAIALAMVRREVEPGTTVAVRWDGGEAQADVTRLPFAL